MVAEGGWSSASSFNSSPDLQRRYIVKQGELLDSIQATAVVQTLLADLDLTTYPSKVRDSLVPFVSIGLTASNFDAKPALNAWDGLRVRNKI